MRISGYRCMWIIVLFDLPTDTKHARRSYADFRKFLLEDGYTMMQYSVYMRSCASRENMEVHINRVHNHLPPDGEVRVIAITDKQFERMEVFLGRKRKPTESPPLQLQLF